MRCRVSINLVRLGLLAAAALTAGVCLSTTARGESFWRQIIPRKRIEADPKADYTVSDRNGPWHVMATSFHGPEGERDARELVLELRSRFNLPAYYYAKTFELEDLNPGLGLDQYGGRIKRRYQRGNVDVEHAVLVGDFPTIDDPEAQDLLVQIKSMEPDTLKIDSGEDATQSLASVRNFYRDVRRQIGKSAARGPMGHAFMTRNPVLPAEYFTGGQLEADVAKWNEGLEYSLMHCPAKYTIKVATFRGRSSFARDEDEQAKKPRTRWAKDDDPLVVAGQNAHKMAVALREKGWEAYEFHDRHESYVTVGAFSDMQRLPDGRIVPATHDAQVVVNTFGAASPNVGFEKPSYESLGVDEAHARKVEQDQAEIMRQFSTYCASGVGKPTEGLHPKRLVGLPFDVFPQPIEVPRTSLAAAYVRN
jgi:hypothetical protein